MKKLYAFIAVAVITFTANSAFAATPEAMLESRINMLDTKKSHIENVWERASDFLQNAEDHGVDTSDVDSEYESAKSSYNELQSSIDETKEALESKNREEIKASMLDLHTAFDSWRSDMRALFDEIKEVRTNLVDAA